MVGQTSRRQHASMDAPDNPIACTPVALVWHRPRDDLTRDLRCLRTVAAALRAQARRRATVIHAYVLLQARIELLVSVTHPAGLEMLRHILHVANVDPAHWATPRAIRTEEALWTWHRRIDLAPVRALRADTADAYRWCSHAALAHGDDDAVVLPHPAYLALGDDGPARRRAYRALTMCAPAASMSMQALIAVRLGEVQNAAV